MHVRRWTQRVHLWASLVLSTLLLVVTLSGTALILMPELEPFLHPELYQTTPVTTPVGFEAARQAVQTAFPERQVQDIVLTNGST